MLKYQTTESYAPLGPMSGANYVLTAGLIHLCKISEPVAGEQFGGTSKLFSESRSAFARLASRSFRLLPRGQSDIVRTGRIVGQLESFGLWWSNHMAIKALDISEVDLIRARDRALMDALFLKELSSDQTAIVVRAIAQGIAEGRKEGLELAKCPHD
jgi:hypothetical protein